MAAPSDAVAPFDPDGPSVLLVAMPFMSLDLAPISIGLLQAELRRAGLRADAAYLGFDLANAIGANNYQILMNQGALLGEWVFVEALYGRSLADDELDVLGEVHKHWYLWDDATRASLRGFRAVCNRFIDWCVDARPWGDYDLVGFSSTFHQNLASLALGRRIKQRHPEVKVAYGGSNWQGEMGRALHESFAWIDFAAIGEGEGIIVDLAHAARGTVDPATIAGIVHRAGDESIATGPSPRTDSLDDLPVPDYEDWVHQRRRARVCVGRPARLVFESSRGCWWGERSHCTFCGLNAEGMASRRKSAGRVLAELHELRDRFGINAFTATDTILPIPFFRDLLPGLAAVSPRFDVFYETKANLSPAKVKLLADAGITEIQPGIESLSDHVLGLVRKGITGLGNIQLLRWCAEFGVQVDWPILTGVPYETRQDYEDFRDLAEACTHLPPPAHIQSVEIHRFSPFHETPEALGYTNVRPNPVYRLLYPVDEAQLARIAYTFLGDRLDAPLGQYAPDHGALLAEVVERWQEHGGQGGLWMRRRDDAVEIADERTDPPSVTTLTGWQAQLFEACDTVRSRHRLGAVVDHVSPDEVDGFLDRSVAAGHLLRSGDRYLALPVYRPARTNFAAGRARLEVLPG